MPNIPPCSPKSCIIALLSCVEGFGKNYPQFYHKGSEAIGHLLQKRSGQVKGAFYKEGIGDIDLIWGGDKIGLQKIIAKHSNDFVSFGEGQNGIINGLSEIIEQGKTFEKNNVKTIWHKKDNAYYAVGLSKGWYGKGDNEWVITGYKKTKGEIPKEIKGDTANLSAYSDKFNPLLTSKDEPLNLNAIIPQSPNTLQALEKYAPNLADEARLNNLSKDLQELAKNFKATNTDKENAKLFDRALIVAQQLGVKVKANASTTKQGVLGSFNIKTNTIEIFTKDKAKQSETILHELIHATTLKALKADENLLTPLQKEAVKEVKEAYDILSKDARLKGEYGLTSVEEMLAELSNKTFRDKLEHKGILRKILDAITNIFFKNKTNKSVKYEDLKASLYKIIDNYNVEGKGYGNSTHYKLNPQQKEAKGLYNVTYNGKNATRVLKDLEAVNEAILFEKGNRYKGAKHIRIKHLSDASKEGYVKPIEVANLGKDLRNFLKDYEPFEEVQKGGQKANIYEWENKEGVRFRLVVNDIADMDSNPTTATQEIITFYSDRNLKERMQFKNHKVQEAYEKEINKELTPQIQAKFKFDEKKAKDLAEIPQTQNLADSNEVIPQTKLQSNVHIGSGLASGSVAGFETDEQGNLSFNPTNFLLGLAGGALGSKAIAKGFKAISKNPELKAKVTKELADTLSKGWDSAVKQYPILESLQPRSIVKNEKGRDLQAKHILREVEKESQNMLKSATKLKGKVVTNLQNGMEASISSDGISKMISVKAVDKSLKNGYTKEDHFASVENVLKLYKISKLTQSETPLNKSVDVVAYHKFIADFRINQKDSRAKITLRETYQAGNRIYSLELLELEKASN